MCINVVIVSIARTYTEPFSIASSYPYMHSSEQLHRADVPKISTPILTPNDLSTSRDHKLSSRILVLRKDGGLEYGSISFRSTTAMEAQSSNHVEQPVPPALTSHCSRDHVTKNMTNRRVL